MRKNKKFNLIFSNINGNSFYVIIRTEFAEKIQQSGNIGDEFIIVLKDDIKVKMDLKDDRNFVGQQTTGMANFFSQTPLEKKQLLE